MALGRGERCLREGGAPAALGAAGPERPRCWLLDLARDCRGSTWSARVGGALPVGRQALGLPLGLEGGATAAASSSGLLVLSGTPPPGAPRWAASQGGLSGGTAMGRGGIWGAGGEGLGVGICRGRNGRPEGLGGREGRTAVAVR